MATGQAYRSTRDATVARRAPWHRGRCSGAFPPPRGKTRSASGGGRVTDSLALAQALGVELTPEAGDLLERVQRHERAARRVGAPPGRLLATRGQALEQLRRPHGGVALRDPRRRR